MSDSSSPQINTAENQRKLHDLGVPRTPIGDEQVYIVRISQKSVGAQKDYEIMKDKIDNGYSSEWDSVKGNRVKVGDWMGFILGEASSAEVELYQVGEIKGPEHRPKHWANRQYTSQQVQESVKNREVVVFKNQKSLTIDWAEWKEDVGYKEKYMPRGTVRARSPW